MKKKILPLFFIAAVSLTACGNNYHYEDHLSDYVMNIDLGERTNFKILQLTDFHVSDKDDQDELYRYIDTLVEDAKTKYGVDFIVCLLHPHLILQLLLFNIVKAVEYLRI